MAEEGPPTEDPRVPTSNAPRITVVENVYHQLPGETTRGSPPARFYRWLESDEEPYLRSPKIGLEWVPLDLGHLAQLEISMVVIGNFIKRMPSRRPTQDEIDLFNSQILEVGLEEGGQVTLICEIPVSEDMRLPNPSALFLSRVRIRCRAGNSKYTIFLTPR